MTASMSHDPLNLKEIKKEQRRVAALLGHQVNSQTFHNGDVRNSYGGIKLCICSGDQASGNGCPMHKSMRTSRSEPTESYWSKVHRLKRRSIDSTDLTKMKKPSIHVDDMLLVQSLLLDSKSTTFTNKQLVESRLKVSNEGAVKGNNSLKTTKPSKKGNAKTFLPEIDPDQRKPAKDNDVDQSPDQAKTKADLPKINSGENIITSSIPDTKNGTKKSEQMLDQSYENGADIDNSESEYCCCGEEVVPFLPEGDISPSEIKDFRFFEARKFGENNMQVYYCKACGKLIQGSNNLLLKDNNGEGKQNATHEKNPHQNNSQSTAKNNEMDTRHSTEPIKLNHGKKSKKKKGKRVSKKQGNRNTSKDNDVSDGMDVDINSNYHTNDGRSSSSSTVNTLSASKLKSDFETQSNQIPAARHYSTDYLSRSLNQEPSSMEIYEDGYREAYIKALAMAQIPKLPQQPWMLSSRISKPYDFSYFEPYPQNSYCDACEKWTKPKRRTDQLAADIKPVKHVFGKLNVNDFYPGGKRNPIEMRKKYGQYVN